MGEMIRLHGTSLATARLGKELTYSERSTIRDPNWQICKYSKQSVCHWRPERKIVGDFMNGEEEILVCRSPNNICCQKELP